MKNTREILGAVNQEQQDAAKKWLKRFSERAESIYKLYGKLVVPRERIDPRILSLEEELNKKNKDRAAFYGREYIAPQVIYIDKFVFAGMANEFGILLNMSGMIEDLTSDPRSFFSARTNTVMVASNSFEDPEIDAFWMARSLQHEMAHAGSVQKFKICNSTDAIVVNLKVYRFGSVIASETKGRQLGAAILEGHTAVEGALLDGRFSKRFMPWGADRFISPDQQLQKRFSRGRRNYYALANELTKKRFLPPGQLLTGLQPVQGNPRKLFLSHGEGYPEYVKLMSAIYDRDPKMFRFTEDLIYGDNFVAFARELERAFGSGFFGKLMGVSGSGEAESFRLALLT